MYYESVNIVGGANPQSGKGAKPMTVAAEATADVKKAIEVMIIHKRTNRPRRTISQDVAFAKSIDVQ